MEEAHLRSVEATVRLWLVHHPGRSIEDGKTAVLDALKERQGK
jgi:hypothetical protein